MPYGLTRLRIAARSSDETVVQPYERAWTRKVRPKIARTIRQLHSDSSSSDHPSIALVNGPLKMVGEEAELFSTAAQLW